MPTRKDVQELNEAIKNSSDLLYVFSRLDSTQWIKPMVDEKLFSRPYEPKEENGRLITPLWPPSAFLVRMAERDLTREQQEAVLEGALAIPPTNNFRVNWDLASVATHLDADLGERLVDVLRRFLATNPPFVPGRKLGQLISHLAQGGRHRKALEFARSLLYIPPSKPPETESAQTSALAAQGVVLNEWDYAQVLTNNVPDLIRSVHIPAWMLLCDLLATAIDASRTQILPPEDFSHLWRPAVEDHSQNWSMGLRQVLLDSVRDRSVELIEIDRKYLRVLIDELLKRATSAYTFQRIALWLLSAYAEDASDIARQQLLNREAFDATTLRHEYFLLSKRFFKELSNGDKNTILSWIDAGIPESLQKRIWENVEANFGFKPDQSYRENALRQWKRERLAPIADDVAEDWKVAHAELFEDSHKPQHPEFTTYFESSFGPSLPAETDKLAALSVKDLVSFLGGWEPSGDAFSGSTPESMGRELTDLISESPARYASEALEFAALTEPTYVRAVIQGFDFAIRQQKAFSWTQLAEFCRIAASRKGAFAGRRPSGIDADPSWEWTGTAVARLVTAGFTSNASPLPIGMREVAWNSIVPLTESRDPSPEREEEFVDITEHEKLSARRTRSAFDPYVAGMNSARGAALEAVVMYALWVKKSAENGTIAGLESDTFNGMPEVAKVLEAHLSIEHEPSLAIRAIYGQKFPLIHFIAPRWAAQKVGEIFPRSDRRRWHAAWDSYVVYNPAYDAVLQPLQDEYEYAITQIGKHEHAWGGPKSADDCLVEHLLGFYWRGKLSEDKDLIKALYVRADGQLAAHGMSYVGTSMRNEKVPLSEDVKIRLVNLWERRLAAAQDAPQVGAKELKEFGWWFASGKLADDWSLQALLDAVTIAGGLDPDFLVVEGLARLASSKPRICVQILERMIKGDTKEWAILGWTDDAVRVLKIAYRSSDMQARQLASDLTNYLGSLGMFNFGEVFVDEKDLM